MKGEENPCTKLSCVGNMPISVFLVSPQAPKNPSELLTYFRRNRVFSWRTEMVERPYFTFFGCQVNSNSKQKFTLNTNHRTANSRGFFFGKRICQTLSCQNVFLNLSCTPCFKSYGWGFVRSLPPERVQRTPHKMQMPALTRKIKLGFMCIPQLSLPSPKKIGLWLNVTCHPTWTDEIRIKHSAGILTDTFYIKLSHQRHTIAINRHTQGQL